MATRLADGVRARAPRTREEALEALVGIATSVMSAKSRKLNLDGAPACVLLYGVNGAGKTTTAGKLAHMLQAQGRKPLVVAADTYRAAGIEQMVAWAERAGVPHFEGTSGADPASQKPALPRSYLTAVAKIAEMYASHRYELALIEAVDLEQQYPKEARIEAMKGSLYQKLGKATLARAAWKKALEIDPSDTTVAEALRALKEE